jgi:hypothetical protein
MLLGAMKKSYLLAVGGLVATLCFVETSTRVSVNQELTGPSSAPACGLPLSEIGRTWWAAPAIRRSSGNRQETGGRDKCYCSGIKGLLHKPGWGRRRAAQEENRRQG